MKKIVVIGGGPAGMMAAYAAASNGNEVTLIEKNEKLGKKLYITGKGRCNLTNNVSKEDFLQNVVTNAKFLYGAINCFAPEDTVSFFEDRDCRLKTERGNRVFPESDKASDITKTFVKELEKDRVRIELNTTVKSIMVQDGSVSGVKTDNETILCNSVVLCTGGASYPLTGSTGDGYVFAKDVGHTVITPKPSLVGIELKGEDFLSMQGLSLKNVSIKVCVNDRVVYEDFGEMLFTHFGVSGPIILSASCILNKFDLSKARICIDLKPALTEKTLDDRLIREFSASNKTIATTMRSLLPQSLIFTCLKRVKINKDKRCSEITREDRSRVAKTLKSLDFDISRLRPLDEAIVTSGGISVKEIDPKTMESKLVKGLFFAGEVIDVDAFTGGFNIQIAMSTGFLAGKNA